MIDWVIQVFQHFPCSKKTFFLTISLIDRYYKFASKKLASDDVHIIGITCIFIAVKYEEIRPICMKQLVEQIGFGAFRSEQILEQELDILKCL